MTHTRPMLPERWLELRYFAAAYRFRILFLILGTLLLIYPFFVSVEPDPQRELLFSCVFGIVLIACAAAGSLNRRQMVVSLCLFVPTFALHWTQVVIKDEPTFFSDAISLGYLLVCVHTTYTVLRYVASAPRVTQDVLAGAVSVYLLLGLNWAIAYNLVGLAEPGAIEGIPGEGKHLTDYLYFSFTTLTTLGYGEIVPVNGYARALSNLESVTGVLYLAAFVARLISAYNQDNAPID